MISGKESETLTRSYYASTSLETRTFRLLIVSVSSLACRVKKNQRQAILSVPQNSRSHTQSPKACKSIGKLRRCGQIRRSLLSGPRMVSLVNTSWRPRALRSLPTQLERTYVTSHVRCVAFTIKCQRSLAVSRACIVRIRVALRRRGADGYLAIKRSRMRRILIENVPSLPR